MTIKQGTLFSTVTNHLVQQMYQMSLRFKSLSAIEFTKTGYILALKDITE